MPKADTAFNEELIVAENYAGGEIHAWRALLRRKPFGGTGPSTPPVRFPASLVVGGDQFGQLEPNWKSPVGKETLEMEGGLKILLSLIVAIIVLAVVYTCALTFMKRKEVLRRKLTAPDIKEHGVDLQTRRKTYDDVT